MDRRPALPPVPPVHKGPFRRFGPVFDIEPDGKGGSHVAYALEWEPLSLVGRAFGARLAAQAGEAVGKRILEAVAFAPGSVSASALRRSSYRRLNFHPARGSGQRHWPAKSTAARTAMASAAAR